MIEEGVVKRTLDAALATGGEWAEVFVEDRRSSSAVLDDAKVEELTSGRDRGAGIRVVVGETTGFAHTADLSEPGLRTAAEAAAAAARGGSGGIHVVDLTRADVPHPNVVEIQPSDVPKARKVELLTRADEVARAEGGAINQVMARYADSRRRILIANSDGLLTGDDQVKTLFSVSCVATGDTGMQTGRESTGYTVGFELFDLVDVEEMARRAARRALTKLGARPAPSGAVPVVIASGGGGVLFHEACGHGLEADLVGKGASVFKGRQGEKVANEMITLVDDGTMAHEWGCFAVDDEGRPAQRNVLIQDGVLTDYMWDFLRARKEGRASSGNGRRQSYQHLPMVRMTNTFLENGSDDPAEIIASTDSGVFVKQLGGGQVNTATGDFVFGMTEAYLIEGGEVTDPIREGNLIGNGPDVLTRIDALGNDFSMGPPGTCGKDGQGVPVGDGIPTLRVSSLTVGGTRGLTREHRVAMSEQSTEPTSFADLDGLLEIGDRVVAMARSGEQVEAVVVAERDTEVRVFNGDVESFSSAESRGVGVRVVAEGRQGFAYAGTLDDDVLAETLDEARDNAGFGTPDEYLGLAEPDDVAVADLDLWRDELEAFPTESKIDLTVELERLVLDGDPRMAGVESAEYGDTMANAAIVTSTGIRSASRETACFLMTYALADDDGETQTGFGWSLGRRPDELDAARAADDAVTRATRLLGASKPQSERLTVVLDPFVTAQLVGIIASTLGGEAVLKGRSLFADRVGQSVAAAGVTIVDDPTNPEAFTATESDGEGLATRRNVLVDGGVLEGFVHNAYTARRMGTSSTGSAIRSFKSTPGAGCMATVIEPGTRSQAELIAAVDNGVLIQDVAGLHSGVNPVSGDFSTGADGLRIRGGEVAEPIREFTIASTLQRMLLDIVAVGSDLEWLPMSAAGVTLVIDDVTVSGE